MKYILTSLLLCSIIFASNVSGKEGEWWIDMTIASKHGEDNWEDNDGTIKEYNENHFGLGLVYGLNDYVDLSFGFIDKNSFENRSYYGGANVKYPIFDAPDILRIEPGIMLGVASGYNGTPEEKFEIAGGVLPMPIPNVNVIVGDYFLGRVGWMPGLGSSRTTFVLFQASVRFF